MALTFDWTFGFVTIFIASIFVADGLKRVWRSNEWKRQYKRKSS